MEEEKITPNFEDDTVRALYEATVNGSISALETLNPLTLSKVSFSPFGENALHIASLFGYLKLCVVLLEVNPSLASEVDSKGHYPLHLASTEGHIDIVKTLLMENQDICLIPDNDDKLPIHLAVSGGHVEVVEELKNGMSCSIQNISDDGSILHLCVRYNHLEALKYIVLSVSGAQELLHVQDKEGNTILHWAVNLKQIKTIKFLLSLPKMRASANTLNNTGLTPLDILNNCSPTDFTDIAIQYILKEAGVQKTCTNPNMSTSNSSSSTEANDQSQQPNTLKNWENFWSKYIQHQRNWIEESRGTLMIVATVISTMTFQSALNPPGGVWQENTHNGVHTCTTYGICQAGTAIVGYDWAKAYIKFMSFNTISFFASLCVVLILACGFPLQNMVIMWILNIVMTIAITFMLLTYIWAIGLVAPYHIYYKAYWLGFILGGAWGVILLVLALIQIVRFVFWIKERKKKRKKLHTRP
ncbi:unnamed protein product [Trifolium pratense]|uniref:Uncharacterized protein n=1 Tax=Trifolium pratense TaxID=57577 RepID=A0ACB0ILE8_TRIPR|nr:unnamed protein product [Trifolium pratense]